MDPPALLLDGLAFGESPRWHDGRLWLADWGAREILAVDGAGAREVTLAVDFPAFPMCFDWLPGGDLVVVASEQRRLLRRKAAGDLALYADLATAGDHAWNEIVVDGRGNAYVNGAMVDAAAAEFGLGRIALVTPDGTVREVAHDMAFPNGMAVTPDGSTLIVAESYGRRLTAFAIDADGGLSGRRVWADLGDGTPDGICIDAEGAVWYADVPHQRCDRVREGGEVLDRVELDRGGFACMLGGPDGRTLHIVATVWRGMENMDDGTRTGQVLTVDAPAPAAGRP